MNRRQFGAAVAALGVTSVTTGAETAVHVERLQLSRNGWMPNNERLPVLLYRREFEVTGDVLGEWKRGMDKGEVRKVCTEPNCLIHHSKKQQTKGDSSLKVEQEKRRREEAIAATAGMRILAAIADAIPVRLMKRDLLFVAERLLPLLDDRRPLILGKGRSIRPKCDEAIGKLLTAHARKADEGTLGKLIVEAVILLSVCSGNTAEKALKTAAQTYKVDSEAINRKVQYEFAMKEKSRQTAEGLQSPPANRSRIRRREQHSLCFLLGYSIAKNDRRRSPLLHLPLHCAERNWRKARLN